jgi:hypothetical protein
VLTRVGKRGAPYGSGKASVKETRMVPRLSRCLRHVARARATLHFCDGVDEGLPQDALRLT